MLLRPKTKRRLVILLAGLLVASVLAGALVVVQLHRLKQQHVAERAMAMAAFKQGKYHTALAGLSQYLNNNFVDAEAVRAYAISLTHVPTPDQSNLTRAISAYRRYLELRPNDQDARKQLLALYTRTGFAAEGLSLADRLLKTNPGDVDALLAKMHLLELQSQYPAALAVARRLDQIQPDELSNQIETYRLMALTKLPAKALTDRADAMLRPHAGKPRLVLLRAVAAYYANEPVDARHWLDTAAAGPAPDAEFVRILSNVLDRLGDHRQSYQVLLKGAASIQNDPTLLATLVLRQWQDGQYTAAANRLSKIDRSPQTADSTLIALDALVHFTLAQSAAPRSAAATQSSPSHDKANAINDLHILNSRSNDTAAAAWALLLHTRFDQPSVPVKLRIERYESVSERDPGNAIARLYLGFAERQLGERDLAVTAWRQAARLSPGWATPYLLIARTLLNAGRYAEASQAAQAAEDRAPDRLIVQTTLAQAVYAQLGTSPDSAAIHRLLKFVTAIQTNNPREPSTLPIYVDLLARTGQQHQAEALVREMLSANPPPTQTTLDALLHISKQQKLGLSERIENSRNRAVSITPAQALARAIAVADTGHPADGLALLQDLADTDGPDAASWQVVMLRYRQYTGDNTVLPAWVSLGNKLPTSVAVQRAILASTLAWTDRSLIDKTINRLKKLTGPDGVQWRLARARFDLSWGDSADPTQQSRAAAAATSLAEVARDAPQSVEAQLLWADAKQQLGDRAGAIEHARRATELAPADPVAAMTLAKLLLAQGKTDEADQVLLSAAKLSRLSRPQRMELARELADRALYTPAADLLTADPDHHDTEADILLAKVCDAQGDTPAAAAIYNTLLRNGEKSQDFIRSAAWFFANHGQNAIATKVLDRLKISSLSNLDQQAIWTQYEEAFGTLHEARARLLKCIAANPHSPDARAALMGFDIRHRAFDDAEKDFTAATAAGDADPSIDGLGQILALARKLPSNLTTGKLLDIASRQPLNKAAVQTLDAVVNHPQKLPAISDRFPNFMPAQLLLAEREIARGATNRAADVLTRAAMVDPTDPAAPRVSTQLDRSLGEWKVMATAAAQWRKRSLNDPLAADLALTTAYLHTNNADAALSQLSPYIQFALSHPQSNQTVLRLYCAGLCMSGYVAKAREILDAQIDKSSSWRAIALDVAARFCPTTKVAAAWIEHISPMTEPSEQVDVAIAWETLGKRLHRKDFLTRAHTSLSALASQPHAPAKTWLALATTELDLSNMPAAASAYRRALQTGASDPAISNNLAYALLISGGNLTDARTAAQHAVAARPDDATFQSTLGQISRAMHDIPAATTAFQKALQSDPNNQAALLGMAQVDLHAQRLADAGTVVKHINSLARSSRPLSPRQRDQLNSVRAALHNVSPATTQSAK